MTKPSIIAREEWDAEAARGLKLYADDASNLSKYYDTVVVHHDASVAPPDVTSDEGKAIVHCHQQTHLSNGWADIGYHYLIDPAGRIYSGRTMLAVGSHVYRQNTGKLGVCLMGSFDKQDVPKAQIDALVSLLSWACDLLDVDPDKILGHRDFLPTECPGKSLYAKLPEVRARVKKAFAANAEPVADHADRPLLVVGGAKPITIPYAHDDLLELRDLLEKHRESSKIAVSYKEVRGGRLYVRPA